MMLRDDHGREAVWLKGRWRDRLRYAILEHNWRVRQDAVNAYPSREVNT